MQVALIPSDPPRPWEIISGKLTYFRYGRIVDRISRNPNIAERVEAKKLLGWIVCAKRPLKWHEIQGAVSINLEEETVDFDVRRLRIDARDLCGSLLEVRPGHRVELVHGTAQA